jgi:hypothetical protein
MFDFMKRHLLATIVAAVTSYAHCAEMPKCFLGRWKSNEVKTLADMRLHGDISEKARKLFEEKFFGRLVMIVGPRRSFSYFTDMQTSSEIEFEDNDVVEAGDSYVVLRYKISNIPITTKWFCEGNEIYALVSRWEFREYFSPY